MEGIALSTERPGVAALETGPPFTHDELWLATEAGFLHWALRQPHRFWAPIQGLYGGVRVNEVAQLRAAGVMLVGGVSGFLATIPMVGSENSSHPGTSPERMLSTRAKARCSRAQAGQPLLLVVRCE